MREGYTYDDEMPSAHGSYVNRHRRPIKFTGKRIGTIGIDPVTRELKITVDKPEDRSSEDVENKEPE